MATTTANDGYYGADSTKPTKHPQGLRSARTTFGVTNGTHDYDIAALPINTRGVYQYTAAIVLGSANNCVGTVMIVQAGNSVGGGTLGTPIFDNSSSGAAYKINSFTLVSNGSDTIIRANITSNGVQTAEAEYVLLAEPEKSD